MYEFIFKSVLATVVLADGESRGRFCVRLKGNGSGRCHQLAGKKEGRKKGKGLLRPPKAAGGGQFFFVPAGPYKVEL